MGIKGENIWGFRNEAIPPHWVHYLKGRVSQVTASPLEIDPPVHPFALWRHLWNHHQHLLQSASKLLYLRKFPTPEITIPNKHMHDWHITENRNSQPNHCSLSLQILEVKVPFTNPSNVFFLQGTQEFVQSRWKFSKKKNFKRLKLSLKSSIAQDL